MLRSIQEVQGYMVQATDGSIGSIDEFLFDDQSWTIRYAVVNTGPWLFGRKVLITPSAFKQPDFNHRTFPVELSKEQIKRSPERLGECRSRRYPRKYSCCYG